LAICGLLWAPSIKKTTEKLKRNVCCGEKVAQRVEWAGLLVGSGGSFSLPRCLLYYLIIFAALLSLAFGSQLVKYLCNKNYINNGTSENYRLTNVGYSIFNM